MDKNSSEINKLKCKQWREKLKLDKTKFQNNKQKNSERMRNARKKWRELADENMVKKRRELNRMRQQERRQKLLDNRILRQNQNAPYSCKQTLGKAVKKSGERDAKGNRQKAFSS